MRRRIVLAALALTLIPLSGATQERGALLVASTDLRDPRFSETVLLLIHHDADGAIGIAINRPTWISTEQLFPGLPYLHRYRGTVFHGGPLARANVLVLSRGLSPGEQQTEPLLDDIYVSTNLDFLEQGRAATDDEVVRFYAGHASWGPGQLDDEIEAGGWHVVPASAELVFTDRPRALWSRLVAVASGAEMRAGTAPGAAGARSTGMPSSR